MRSDSVQLRRTGSRELIASIAVRAAIAVSFAVSFVLAEGTARAIPYETFIDIDDQADLEDLLASGDITATTYDELLDLLQVGIDLSTADRAQLYALPNLTYDDVDAIIAFREKQNGIINDPAALVGAGALSEDKLLAISAFILVRPPGDKLGVRGWVRGQTRVSNGDRILPPFALRGRFTFDRHLAAGFAGVFTRLDIGAPVYDPNRDALVASPRQYSAALPKVYLKYEDNTATAIAGSFRAGFGQRLTFDNSRNYTPNGLYLDDQLFFSTDLALECRESAGELGASPCEGEDGNRYMTPDWGWREGLFGVGAGAKRIELGTGWIQLYGWVSAARRSIYQYELVDRGKCEDPHDDNDPNCAAPTVYVRPDGDILDPTSRFSFVTLPDVFSERLGGANVTFFADRRNAVGLTAFVANEKNLVEGIDLDTQEWSRLPTGKTFGAGGANFSFGQGWLDVFGEGTYSFDKLPDGPGPQVGGGGPAGILRITATKKKQELETTLRFYDVDFANPYARPIAQSDEFDGQRARDEVGGRIRYIASDKRVSIRTAVDVWAPVSSFYEDAPLGRIQPKLDSYVRADVRSTDELKLGLWLRYQDKDLKQGGHDECFEVTTDTNVATGEPIPCGGRQLTTIGRAGYKVDKTLDFTAMLQHQLVDDDTFSEESFRQDLSAWLIVLYRPEPGVRVRTRLRYLDEAWNDGSPFGAPDEKLERSFSALVDGAFRLRDRDTFRARVDAKFWLDDRASTMERAPNPELQLWLSYEAKL